MDAAEFEQFTARYYQHPRVDVAPEALKWYATSSWARDPLSAVPMRYFFTRLAQNDRLLIPAYTAVLREVTGQGMGFVQEVLTNVPTMANALDRPIRTATDNDLHWVEFAVLGREAPVVRLIDVLEWPDRVRDKLDAWLRQPAPSRLRFPFHRRYRTQWSLHSVAGIVCDLASRTIDTPDDLDCRCMLDGLAMSRERLVRVRRVLPFPLSDDDLRHMGTKASAKWSLASNCEQDQTVRTVCVTEAARRSGRVRLALHDIIRSA
jgi:hypothetical protein